MAHRVLIAVDGSQGAMRAVEYAGQVFAGNPDAWLVLFQVLPVTSRLLLEKKELETIEARKVGRPDLTGLYWSPKDQDKMNQFFARATRALVEAGVSAEQIKSKFIVKYGEIAGAILEEARLGNYQTLIMGRRGLSRIKQLLMGSVSGKVVREARHIAVWVID